MEGPAKLGLVDVTFPVDQGLAGYVYQTQKSAIFNDVQQDHRFYGKFDSVSGFQTKNLVAIPLVAGDEKIGVLEVLNKAGDEPFMKTTVFSSNRLPGKSPLPSVMPMYAKKNRPWPPKFSGCSNFRPS